ncbi:MAG TPA: TonB family protein [Terriglobales bacterium]|nr:TonB family protein [Terriglobales bacterium]
MPEKPEPEDYRFLLENKPFWRDFLDQLKDKFAPAKQPELVLESKPIPVKDIWSAPKSLKSRMGSVAVHLAVVGVMLLPFWRPVQVQIKKMVPTEIFLPPKVEPPMPKIRRLSGGGAPVVRPQPQLLQAPKPQPVTAPTAMVPLAEAMNAPSFGAIGPISGPPGAGGGSGGGPGGTGSGSEGGTCTGNDCGDGVGVTSPIAVYSPDPEYSEAARKAKFQGTCEVQVTIGVDGHVHNAHVVQPLGLGLDEKAVQAVLLWRFTPAKDKNGRPVAVTANIEVNFRLF